MVTKHSPVWDQLKKKHCSSKIMTEVTVPANVFNDITLGSLPSRDQANKSAWGKCTRFWGWGRKTTIILAWTVKLNEDLESSRTSQRGVRAEPSNGKVEAGFNARPSQAKEGQNQYHREILKLVASGEMSIDGCVFSHRK